MIADLPKRFVIESTTACSLRCTFCPTGQEMLHRSDLMSWGLFTKLTDELENFVEHIYIEFMGEPTLHPRIGDMVRRCREFAAVDLATNGVSLTPELAKEIAVCNILSVTICGLGETYTQVHGVPAYDEAIRGLRYLLDAAPGRVNWTWMEMRENEHQKDEARAIAEDMGARFGVKGCAFGLNRKDRIATKNPQGRRYDDEGRLLFDRSTCREFWEVGYVCSEGTVVTCGFDSAALMPMGNVTAASFASIWNGPKYQALRQAHLGGKLTPICRLLCGSG